MRFLCTCEETIRDQTDNLPYKARCLPDHVWDDFFDRVDEAVEADPPTTIERSDELTFAITNHRAWRFMYQCEKCGRLYIQDHAYNLIEFVPAVAEEAKGLFAKREGR